MQLFAGIEAVEVIVLGREGSDEAVLKLFLQTDGLLPCEHALCV